MTGGPSWTPIHIEANRRALEAIIDIAYKDKLIPHRYSVDDLFVDTTRRLACQRQGCGLVSRHRQHIGVFLFTRAELDSMVALLKNLFGRGICLPVKITTDGYLFAE